VRGLLLVVALAACGSNKSAPPAETPTSSDVHIDRRVELMSIVCALAGFKEYTLGRVNPYRTEVIAAFRGFVQHPAVVMARDLRAQHGIGYDAPMILAVHLDDQLALRNAAELPQLDARWKGVDAEAYAALLRDFARDAKLDEFLAAHRAHYTKIEDVVRGAVDAEKPVAWFDGVFGKRDKAHYTVIPAPMTGRYNFGVRATRADGTLDMYQLISVDTDSGIPVVDADLTYLLVHEMAHSYVNPHLAEHEAELGPPAQKLFAKSETKMRAQAYPTWQIFLNESVVRATTLVYFADKRGEPATALLLDRELGLGFDWTAEISGLIRAYRADHVDYVPRLAALLAQLGQR
jgi:hypothetical protein